MEKAMPGKAPSARKAKAKRLRQVARGYRSLKRPKATVYDAAAEVLEKTDENGERHEQRRR
jgi:hypothetical protein